jgi:cation diffusion facilitator family transporter
VTTAPDHSDPPEHSKLDGSGSEEAQGDAPRGGAKLGSIFAALGANLGVALSKFVAFILTGSSSMLSEAIHSVADSGNQILLLIGNKRAQRERSDSHQFGYGRVRYVYGFIVAIVLFLVGGLFSLYEGFHKIQHPEQLDSPIVAFVVLFIAIFLEGFSLRTALKEARSERQSKSLLRFVHDTRKPELPVVMMEDMGALLGLMFALIGVGMATLTGDGRWDGLGAAAVGVLLVVIAVFLAYEMASMLTGESALPEEQRALEEAIVATPGIERVIHLRTLHIGPEELLVAAKIGVSPKATGQQIANLIDAAEVRLRAGVSNKTLVIYLEPDIDRGVESAAAPQE